MFADVLRAPLLLPRMRWQVRESQPSFRRSAKRWNRADSAAIIAFGGGVTMGHVVGSTGRARMTLVAVALASLAMTLAGCGAPFGDDDAGSDAGDALVRECGDDTEWLHYDYVWGDTAGATGCIDARAREFRWESWNRTAPARRIDTVYSHAAARESILRGLPPSICGANIIFENMSIETGASGALIDETEVTGDGREPSARVGLAYDETPEVTGSCDGALVPARLLSGQWRVNVGGEAGDLVEIEATDVMFADVLGRAFSFPRMRWQVRLGEPTVFP